MSGGGRGERHVRDVVVVLNHPDLETIGHFDAELGEDGPGIREEAVTKGIVFPARDEEFFELAVFVIQNSSPGVWRDPGGTRSPAE